MSAETNPILIDAGKYTFKVFFKSSLKRAHIRRAPPPPTDCMRRKITFLPYFLYKNILQLCVFVALLACLPSLLACMNANAQQGLLARANSSSVIVALKLILRIVKCLFQITLRTCPLSYNYFNVLFSMQIKLFNFNQRFVILLFIKIISTDKIIKSKKQLNNFISALLPFAMKLLMKKKIYIYTIFNFFVNYFM